jgi:hypothetical protein
MEYVMEIQIEKETSLSYNDFEHHFACCDVVRNYINSLGRFLPVFDSYLPVFMKKTLEAIFMPEIIDR